LCPKRREITNLGINYEVILPEKKGDQQFGEESGWNCDRKVGESSIWGRIIDLGKNHQGILTEKLKET
jgi:hypothetical protein